MPYLKDVNSAEKEKRYYEDFYADSKYFEVIDPCILFESISAFENKFILGFFGNLKGKTIADIGAGIGEGSVYFAMKGAKVIWIDIAEEAYKRAKNLAIKYNVEKNIDFLRGDILEFFKNFDKSVDFVYGNGVLHHINWRQLPLYIHSVLRKGGKFAFIEPLRYNLFIEIYRRLTRNMRSPDEKPLGFETKRVFDRYFYTRHKEFWLFSLIVFFKFYLIDRVHPSIQPYWRKIFYDIDECRRILSLTEKIDQILIQIPPLNYLCWNTVIYGENP